MIGQTLAHYRVTAKLGAGGMGEVYRAVDAKLGRDVALKVLPSQMAGDPLRLSRFQREARALAGLNHPYIVTIFSVEEADGVHFLTMELIEGQPLNRLIAEARLEIPRILEIAGAVAEALSAAHEKGIVHRDLKPANVMLARDGRVKVLDFGLAKEIRPGGTVDATLSRLDHSQEGVIMGTPAYMSPEQVSGGAVDYRTDIFSLGILLYEMACGRKPFQGGSSAELASSILRDLPPPIGPLRGDLPADLDRIIRRCMEKDPRQRIQTALDVANELRELSRKTSQTVLQTASSSTHTVTAEASATVVVVLPFINRSPDPGNEYFSDGLTEEIITDLSRIEGLRVISRNSAMALKGTTRDTPSIRKDLGVTHLVSGSVRRAGEALRVTVELVDAASDSPVWSEKYSGTMADVFGIQEEIAEKIVAALKIKLTESGEHRVAERPIANVVAYECYLRARQETYGWTPESQDRAIRLVDQALGIVGENSLLLATKGQVCWDKFNSLIDADEKHLDEALKCAQRALVLDPQNYLGVFVRGLVAGLRGDTAAALNDCYQAHQMNPGDPNVVVELSRFANAAGIDVQDLAEEVVRIDPLTPVAWLVHCSTHQFAGRFEQSLHGARRAVELAPEPSTLYTYTASAIAMAGHHQEALEVLDRAVKGIAAPGPRSIALLFRHALAGDAEKACAQVTAELEQSAGRIDHLARIVADCYSLVGRTDDALRWIRIGMSCGYINYPFIAVHDPFLANVRSHPGFPEVAREVKVRWDALGKKLPPALRKLPLP